jgi:uncharacterized membrane protein YbhN (UPF0104 family)
VPRLRALLANRRLVVALQVGFVAVFTAVLAYFLRDAWRDALPLLEDADPADIAIALGALAAYYLLFVVGWMVILAGLGIRIGYPLALGAEMASMLAKYVPGTIWTPLARILWLRRAGIRQTPEVVGSIAVEAGLSAIAGVLVFALGAAWVDASPAILAGLFSFAVLVAVLLHPALFNRILTALFARFGGAALPELSYRRMTALLGYYAVTWLVGGVALLYLTRSLGEDPGWSSVPYLGGTAAVGAIVTVLSVFAPSGLGVREASMYGLFLAVMPSSVALGVTVLNRLAITLVEAALLAVGIVYWSVKRRRSGSGAWPEPEPASTTEA